MAQDAEARPDPRPDPEAAQAAAEIDPAHKEGVAALPMAGPCGGRPLTTGDLARACDTTVRTVRFYEEAGVLCPETRSEGGHRLFDATDLAKLQLVVDLREAGLSLQEIKELFALKETCGTPEEASARMAQALGAQIDAMQQKIAVLRRLREEMASMVAILEECRTCESTEFPRRCGDCDVMKRADLPRAMRLLWSRCR